MKFQRHIMIALTVLLLGSCAGGLQLSTFGAPTDTPLPPTPTSPPVSTITSAPTLNPSPTVTITPSPTIFVTPTDTPENFVLAESGYDIADVRLSYPREDIMNIDFKYRIAEDEEADSVSVLLDLPRRCQDRQSSAYFWSRDPAGEGRITFKLTLEGECAVESFDLVIWTFSDQHGSSSSDEPGYRETINQSYYLVRNFPTLNKDVVSVRGFEYMGTGEWSGVLRFEYSIAETIPIPPEEYSFSISGRGNDNCDFSSDGPIITEHAGIYEIPIDLAHDLYLGIKDPTCLEHFESHSYGSIYFYVVDRLADATVDFRTLNFPIKVWKTP